MKLTISKSKDGKGHYTTIKNSYNGEDMKMYMPVQLSKNINLEKDFGTYDVNCFLSCYKTQSGEIKPKIVVTSFKEEKQEQVKEEPKKEKLSDDIFSDFGNSIEIEDNDIAF